MNTPKPKLTNQQKLTRLIIGIVILIAGYFGLNVGDLFDNPPDMTQVYELQTQVAVLEGDNAALTTLYETCNDALDASIVSGDKCQSDLLIVQDMNMELAAEVQRLQTELDKALETPVPTPTPSGTPVPICKYVTVTADKVVSHSYKDKNKAGYPIMLPMEKSGRLKWERGEVICVVNDLVRADGGRYFYEVLDPGDVYVDASKVK